MYHFQDTYRNVFGAVLSSPNIKLQGQRFIGTAETFLYTFRPTFTKFNATGTELEKPNIVEL